MVLTGSPGSGAVVHQGTEYWKVISGLSPALTVSEIRLSHAAQVHVPGAGSTVAQPQPSRAQPTPIPCFPARASACPRSGSNEPGPRLTPNLSAWPLDPAAGADSVAA